MKLQILVPQYKEDESIIKPLLDSIEVQQNIDLQNDIGVIIVNDGTDTHLSQDFLNRYSFPIEYHLNEHKGVSVTRNACLDYATADYVMFCDADDMFYNACGMYIIFREIENGGFDSLVSAFIEESREYGTKIPMYINHDMDTTFVHGKVHRRQFLIDNNIQFAEHIMFEDNDYAIVAFAYAQRVKHMALCAYHYRNNPNSITRVKYTSEHIGYWLDLAHRLRVIEEKFINENKDLRYRALLINFTRYTISNVLSMYASIGDDNRREARRMIRKKIDLRLKPYMSRKTYLKIKLGLL